MWRHAPARVSPAVQRAIEIIATSAEADRFDAIELLGRTAAIDQMVCTQLVAMLSARVPLVRASAALALSFAGQAAERAASTLIPLLYDQAICVREAALLTLRVLPSKIEAEVVKKVAELTRFPTAVYCRDLYPTQMILAIQTLAILTERERDSFLPVARSYLNDLAGDVSPEIRAEAVKAIGYLGLSVVDSNQSPGACENVCPIVHCKQRTRRDCGIAAVASITGRAYEEVGAVVPHSGVTSGLSRGDLLTVLARLTGTSWEGTVPRRCERRVRDIPASVPSLLLVRDSSWRGYFRHPHLVIKYQDVVHDPSFSWAFSINDYSGGNRIVLEAYRPRIRQPQG
jgi:hypothetical protein